MIIKVEITKENADGSADAKVHFDKTGLETLVQWGMVGLLTKAMDEYRIRPEGGSKVAAKRIKPTRNYRL